MKTYIGVKIIQAEPCTKAKYVAWSETEAEGPRANLKIRSQDEDEPGYRVLYPDGYVSWSPKEVFEGAYRLVSLEEAALVS